MKAFSLLFLECFLAFFVQVYSQDLHGWGEARSSEQAYELAADSLSYQLLCSVFRRSAFSVTLYQKNYMDYSPAAEYKLELAGLAGVFAPKETWKARRIGADPYSVELSLGLEDYENRLSLGLLRLKNQISVILQALEKDDSRWQEMSGTLEVYFSEYDRYRLGGLLLGFDTKNLADLLEEKQIFLSLRKKHDHRLFDFAGFESWFMAQIEPLKLAKNTRFAFVSEQELESSALNTEERRIKQLAEEYIRAALRAQGFSRAFMEVNKAEYLFQIDPVSLGPDQKTFLYLACKDQKSKTYRLLVRYP